MKKPRTIARKQFEAYGSQVERLNYLREQCLQLRTKAEGGGSALGFTQSFTGFYIGRSVKSGQTLRTKDKTKLLNPKPEMTAELSSNATPNPHANETLYARYIDKKTEYEEAYKKIAKNRDRLEKLADASCDTKTALAIKYVYLDGLTYGEASKKLHYSEGYLRNIVSAGFSLIGERMKDLKEYDRK